MLCERFYSQFNDFTIITKRKWDGNKYFNRLTKENLLSYAHKEENDNFTCRKV